MKFPTFSCAVLFPRWFCFNWCVWKWTLMIFLIDFLDLTFGDLLLKQIFEKWFLQLIVEFFNLEETGDYLCLQYTTYPNGIKRIITLGEDEPIVRNKNIQYANENIRPLTLNDLVLSLRQPAGSAATDDISCESNYLLDVMSSIGAATWTAILRLTWSVQPLCYT